MSGLSPAALLVDSSGNIVVVVNDSGTYRIGTISKLYDSSGTIIDPAKDGTLQTIDGVLDSIKDTDGIKKIVDALPAGTNLLGKVQIRNPGDTLDLGDNTNPIRIDPTGTTTQPISASSLPLPTGAATEATLATADGRLTTIDSVLDSIKDTDGIKKITDPLPAGTNNIGDVDVVSSALPTGAATEATLAGIKTNQESIIDTGNSSTDQLGNGGTFVGTGVDCLGYSAVAITIHSDEDSATDGMKFQFSLDNSNWDDSYSWTLDASASETRRFQFPVTARYFRVNYTNGSTTTTEFRCQTILHRQNILTSIHRLKDNASEDRSAQIVKSAVIAQRAGGPSQDFIPVEADPGGNLKVAIGAAISAGDNLIGRVKVSDGTDVLEISSGGQARTVLYDDVNNVAMPVADETTIPSNTRALLVSGRGEDDKAYILRLDGNNNLKVANTYPTPPAGTTEFVLAQDEANLVVGPSPTYHETVSSVIGNGVDLYIQVVSAGAAGDPSEKGSKVEVFWREGATPTDHLISRIYLIGQTVTTQLPDINKARDGTQLTGNGSNTYLVLRRERLSTAAQEIDGVIRGYTQ